jgi:hypothetical protein
MSQTSTDLSQKTEAELIELAQAARDLRKTIAVDAAAAARRKRLENEVRLADIENATGKTLGVSLAVVWTPGGDMVVIQKPTQIAYESYNLAGVNGPVTAVALHDFITPLVVHPKGIEVERVFEACPGAKLVCAQLANAMCAAEQETIEGKY